jgi:ribosomal protein S18 acetylase RimI-like enzyme
MTKTIVRPYRPEDSSQVAEIAPDLLVEEREELEHWVDLATKFDHYELFVAEADTKVVGLLMLEVAGLHGNLAEIHGISVRRERRRKGYGNTLIREIEDHLREMSVERVYVATNTDNKTAVPFHIKNGYVPKGVLAEWGRLGDDCLIPGQTPATILSSPQI